ncbi:MAG: hypothetical protein ACP5P1_15125 [Acidimicrobiales bacterium]
MFAVGPDRKVKLTLSYPANVGRSVDEILWVFHALQLSGAPPVSTPVNWKGCDRVIISPALSEGESSSRFAKGFRILKPYLLLTTQLDKQVLACR